MKTRPLPHRWSARRPEAVSGGFTLLEMCIVLLIIAILLGALMPAMQSAFLENTLRGDTRELALMVKTAMLESTDEHRTYAIDLTSDSACLRPVDAGAAGASASSSSAQDDDQDAFPAPAPITIAYRLAARDTIFIPDPKKASAWIHMPETTWIFQPNHLSPATRVRFTRGVAYIEMSFNALTGNVEDESAYIP